MKIEGIFLPIITPFKDDKIDYESYEKMINYYINKGVSGIIPLGTMVKVQRYPLMNIKK